MREWEKESWRGEKRGTKREISGKRKLKTESYKVKPRQFLGCCFQDFALAEMVSCST